MHFCGDPVSTAAAVGGRFVFICRGHSRMTRNIAFQNSVVSAQIAKWRATRTAPTYVPKGIIADNRFVHSKKNINKIKENPRINFSDSLLYESKFYVFFVVCAFVSGLKVCKCTPCFFTAFYLSSFTSISIGAE